jgi:hypothetical protein
MALTETDLSQIDSLLATAEKNTNPLRDFRQRFPALSLTRCDASDMGGEAPFRAYQKYNLYLVDGRDHCWHITVDPTIATGIVVAEIL